MDAVITMSIITIMMRSAVVDAVTTMSIIMTMTRSVHAAIIMTMTRSADVDITIMTMMKNAVVDVDIIMIITIIMQMKYLQAGARRQLTNIQRKSWITY